MFIDLAVQAEWKLFIFFLLPVGYFKLRISFQLERMLYADFVFLSGILVSSSPSGSHRRPGKQFGKTKLKWGDFKLNSMRAGKRQSFLHFKSISILLTIFFFQSLQSDSTTT